MGDKPLAGPRDAADRRAARRSARTPRPSWMDCARTTNSSRTRSSDRSSRFTDEDEAIRWANAVEYGLAPSLWTRDHGRAMRVSRQRDFGCVWVHAHIPLVAELPHAGFKHSGYAKDLSSYELEDHTRVKHIMHNIEV